MKDQEVGDCNAQYMGNHSTYLLEDEGARLHCDPHVNLYQCHDMIDAMHTTANKCIHYH